MTPITPAGVPPDEPPARPSPPAPVLVAIGVVGVIALLACAGIAAWVLVPLITASQDAARDVQAETNLHKIGVALHAYHDVQGHFPAPAITDEDGRPLLSWRVALLPYLGHAPLYDRFDFTEPWDSPANERLVAEMPAVFTRRVRERLRESSAGRTVYLAVVDPAAALSDTELTRFQDFMDGLTHTAVVLEVEEGVVWTAPTDLSLEQAIAELSGGEPTNVLFADGAVRQIAPGADPQRARASLTRAGGEIDPL